MATVFILKGSTNSLGNGFQCVSTTSTFLKLRSRRAFPAIFTPEAAPNGDLRMIQTDFAQTRLIITQENCHFFLW